MGRIYFDQLDEDPAFLKPSVQGVSGPNLVLDLQVRAFPNKAVAMSSDQQTIYILVQDQNLQPIAGANGIATIRLPNGEVYSQSFPVNERGVGTVSFNFQNQPNGRLVYVDIAMSYSGLQGTTSTSFRVWY